MRVWEWIKGWKRGIEKEKMQTKTQVKSHSKLCQKQI